MNYEDLRNMYFAETGESTIDVGDYSDWLERRLIWFDGEMRRLKNQLDHLHNHPIKVYAVVYNPMIHESIFGVIGLHRTKRGAEIEMEFSKKERIDEDGELSPFEMWDIREYEIQEV